MAGNYQMWNTWGRTRSPKNLNGANGTAVNVIADTTPLLGVTESGAGYVTENQRYLHVLITDANTTAPQLRRFLGIVTLFKGGLKYQKPKLVARVRTLRTPLLHLLLAIQPERPQHRCHPTESIDVMI